MDTNQSLQELDAQLATSGQPNDSVDSTLIAGDYIKLDKYKLMAAWGCGVLNNQAYIYLALQFPGVNLDDDFNPDEFAEDWKAPKPASDKMKYLKREQIISVLAKLEAKEVIELSDSFGVSKF